MATQTSATLQPNLVCGQTDAATKSTLIQQNQLQILFSLDGISFQLKSFLQRSAVVFVTTCVDSSLMIVISCCQVMPPARRVSWPFRWNQDFRNGCEIYLYIQGNEIVSVEKQCTNLLTVATKPCPYSTDSSKIGTGFLELLYGFLELGFLPFVTSWNIVTSQYMRFLLRCCGKKLSATK